MLPVPVLLPPMSIVLLFALGRDQSDQSTKKSVDLIRRPFGKILRIDLDGHAKLNAIISMSDNDRASDRYNAPLLPLYDSGSHHEIEKKPKRLPIFWASRRFLHQ